MSEQAMVPASVTVSNYFTPEQTDLIKRQIAKGCSDDELKLFLYQCARTGLDPFSRQIYALKRREYSDGQWVEKMSIQTGIDGFRLIAERTGRYSPGPDNDYEYKDGRLEKATAHVMKLAGGTWHKVSASAHFYEYAQTKKEGALTKMWAEKPHIMLGKCAEALALRKAFPAEMSGLYTGDELPEEQPVRVEVLPPANDIVAKAKEVFPGAKEVAEDPRKRLGALFAMPPPKGLGWKKPIIVAFLRDRYQVETLSALSGDQLKDCEQYCVDALTDMASEAAK